MGGEQADGLETLVDTAAAGAEWFRLSDHLSVVIDLQVAS